MNPTGPAERVTVTRNDDDYPLATPVAHSQRASTCDPAHAPRCAEVVTTEEAAPILVDLLDAWFKP